MKNYLPNGSVVLLTGGNKKLIIYGRKQRELGSEKEWDYLACPYPEGYIDQEHTYVFNHEQIESIYFLGFHDREDAELAEILSALPAEPAAAQPAAVGERRFR